MLTLGEDSRVLLQAVAAGRVRRAPVRPVTDEDPPPRFLLDGHGVDAELAALLRDDLIYLPRVGPPQLTPDGEWALTNFI